jgi:hypothetical protein
MRPRLRLLKVVVQPVFVLDDGETLTEQPAQPVEVSAAEWPGFATGRFAESFEELRSRIEDGEPD